MNERMINKPNNRSHHMYSIWPLHICWISLAINWISLFDAEFKTNERKKINVHRKKAILHFSFSLAHFPWQQSGQLAFKWCTSSGCSISNWNILIMSLQWNALLIWINANVCKKKEETQANIWRDRDGETVREQAFPTYSKL